MTAALQICRLGRLYFSSDTVIVQKIPGMPLLELFSFLWRGKNAVSCYCMVISWCFNHQHPSDNEEIVVGGREYQIIIHIISVTFEDVGRIVLYTGLQIPRTFSVMVAALEQG